MVIKMSENKMLAVILIRGLVNISPDVKKTLDLLRLRNKHCCVVIENNDVNLGMVQKVKDYVTYGLISEDLFCSMLDKRGELIGKTKICNSNEKILTKEIAKDYFAKKIKVKDLIDKKIKPFFRLAPPVGGFERKGIKMPFAKGGVLGKRDDEAIKVLITKML